MLDQTFSSEFEVESIVDQKIIDGQTYYLVKWVGYGHEENTWQPLRHMTHSQQKIANWNNYKFKLLRNIEDNKNRQSKRLGPERRKSPQCTEKIIDKKNKNSNSYNKKQSVLGQNAKDSEIELEIQQKEIKQTIFDKPEVKKLIKQKKTSTKRKQLQLFEQRLKSRPKVWEKYLENEEETIKIANQKIKEVIDRVYGANKQKIEQQKQENRQNKTFTRGNINRRSDINKFGSHKMQSQIELENQSQTIIKQKNSQQNQKITNKQIVLQILSDSDHEQPQVEMQKLKRHLSKISKLEDKDKKYMFQQKNDSESDMDESTNFVSKKQEIPQLKDKQISHFRNSAFKSKKQKIPDQIQQNKSVEITLNNLERKNTPKILIQTIKLNNGDNQQKIKQTYIKKLPGSLNINVLIVPDTIRLSDEFIKKHSSKQGKSKKQDKQQKQEQSSLSTNSEYKCRSVTKFKRPSQTSSNNSQDSHNHIFFNDQNAKESNQPVQKQQKNQNNKRDEHNGSPNKQENKQMECKQIEKQKAVSNKEIEQYLNSNMVVLQKLQINNSNRSLDKQIGSINQQIFIQAIKSSEKPIFQTKQGLIQFKSQSQVQINIDKPQNYKISIQNASIPNNTNNGLFKVIQPVGKVPNQCISEQINYASMDNISNEQNFKLEMSYQSIPKSLHQNKQNLNEILRLDKYNSMNQQSQKSQHVTGPFDCSISTIEYIQAQSQIIDTKQKLEINNLEFDFTKQISSSANRNSEIEISHQYASNNNYHIINYSSLTNHISTGLPQQSGESYTNHQNQYILQQNFLRNHSLTTRASFNTHETQIQSHQLNSQVPNNIMGSLLGRSVQTVQKSKKRNDKKDESFYYSAQSHQILNSNLRSIQDKSQNKARSLNLENILQQINNPSLNLHTKQYSDIQANKNNENIAACSATKKIQIDLISTDSKQNELKQNDKNQKIFDEQNAYGEKGQLNLNRIQTNAQLSQPDLKLKKKTFRKRVQNKQSESKQVHSEERIDNKQSKKKKSLQIKSGISQYHRRFILYNDFSYCN